MTTGENLGKTVRISDKNLERIKKNLSDELYNIVERAVGEIDSIIDYINKKKKEQEEDLDDDFMSDSLSVYAIIRSVTFLETFLRTSFIILIDLYDKDFDLGVEISLKHLKQLRKETEITNGQIIADSLNFQKFESSDKEYDVYKIFSKVLGINNIFSEMVKKEKDIPEIHKTIVKLLEERHSIVHDLKYTRWTSQEIEDSATSVLKFVVTLNAVSKLFRTKP